MVKAYQREDAEIARIRLGFDGLYDRLVGLLTGRAKIDPILEVVGGIAVGGVVALRQAPALPRHGLGAGVDRQRPRGPLHLVAHGRHSCLRHDVVLAAATVRRRRGGDGGCVAAEVQRAQ